MAKRLRNKLPGSRRRLALVKPVVAKVQQNSYICGLFIVFIIVFGLLSIVRYDHLLNGFDLAVFNQSIWQLSTAQLPYSSIRDVEIIWGDHFHPIITSLVPFYWLFDTPKTLLIAQSLLVGLALFPLYLFTKDRFGKLTAGIIATAFALYGSTQYVTFFEFHEVAFALPLVAFAIFFISRKIWRGVIVCLILLLLTKEDMALVVAMIGIYLMTLKHYRWGIITFAAALSWLGLLVQSIMPALAGRPNGFSYFYYYDRYGASPLQAIKNAILDPFSFIGKVWGDLTSQAGDKRMTYLKTFGPLLGVLPFFSPLFLLALPLLLLRNLSSSPFHWSFDNHYGGVIGIIIFFSAVDSLWRIYQRTNYKYKNRAVIGLAALTLIINIIFTPLFNYPLWQGLSGQTSASNQPAANTFQTVLARIPSNASVTAQIPLAPPLSQRNQLQLLYPPDQWGALKRIGRYRPPMGEYVAMNRKLDLGYSGVSFDELLQAVLRKDYQITYEDANGWYILKKIPTKS